MARRHLRELLREDQEPFVLKSYIDERRCQLLRPVPRTHSQARKRPTTSENQAFPTNTAKSPLFNSFQVTSYLNKSPLLDLTAKNPSAASRTAAYLLLETALRIHGAQQQKRSKPRGSLKGLGLRFFATVLKRLAKKKRRCEIGAEDSEVSVKDILRWESLQPGGCRRTQKAQRVEEKRFPEMVHSGDSYGSGVVERSETKAKVSSHTKEIGSLENSRADSGPNAKGFSSSPSPTRSAHPQPEFASPAGSPHHQKTKTKRQLFGCTGDDDGVDAEKGGFDEEQEKEQLSPVSVLDPSFHEEEEEEEEEGHLGLHVESYDQSLALVQRAKQQVMRQIRRFERLASLDPVELDKLLAEERDDDDGDDDYDNDNNGDGDGDGDGGVHGSNEPFDDLSYDGPSGAKLKALSGDLCTEEINEVIREILKRSDGGLCMRKIPTDMKILVSDMIEEERGRAAEALAERVHRRLEAWKGVSSNTIDMMVDLDFRREGERWKRCGEEAQDSAAQIEFAIFEFLVCELSDELVITSSPT